MTRRGLAALAASILVLAIGGVIWHFITSEPVITVDRAGLVRVGMTASEVKEVLGGPAGDYAGEFAVTYSRGGVGEDDSGFYEGTNWWGVQGMIQVRFGKEGLVESVDFYPAHSLGRIDSQDRPSDVKRNRHRWVPAHW